MQLRSSPLSCLVGTLAICLALPASSQEESGLNLSINVGTVVIPFVPKDDKGRPIEGLRQKDVRLLVDGRPVTVDLFDHNRDAPVSYTILLDTSGSMGLAGKKEGALAAIRELITQSRPGDDFSLYIFSRGEVRELMPFTTDGVKLVRAAEKIEPFGKTAFYDALALMPDKAILGANGSTAIVLLTDGMDNASSLPRQELEGLMSGIEVPVYPYGLRSRAEVFESLKHGREAMIDLEILAEIARASGGRPCVANEPEELREGIRAMQRELRGQYVIGFSPTGKGKRQYRKVAIEIPNRTAVVVTRAGYNGTEPPWMTSGRVGVKSNNSQ